MCVGEQARASVQGEPGAEQWVTAAAAVTAGVLLDPAAGTHVQRYVRHFEVFRRAV